MIGWPQLSVVVPAHNEETNLPELLRRLVAVLDRLKGGPHRIVIVDDGSTDRTWEILDRAARADGRIAALSLSRNFGHQAALTAGLDHADGEAVVVMDADLQDPPEAIPDFVERYRDGYDVVYARRMRRKEPLWLRACYFIFYRIMARLSDVQLPIDAGDFGLMSRRVIEQLRGMREHHRYLRGLRSWVGFRQVGIPVERSERYSGRSQYGIIGLFRLASDAVFAFSAIPIRAAALLGAAATTVSFLLAVFSIIGKFIFSWQPQGYASLVVLITFLSGVLLLFLGIVGEYVARIYEEVKARPLYLISRRIGLTGTEGSLRPGAAARVAGTAGDDESI